LGYTINLNESLMNVKFEGPAHLRAEI